MPNTPQTNDKPRSVGLILTRRPGELIMLELPEDLGGHRVQISCVAIDRNQVKIVIRAPNDWNIYRGELRGEYVDTGVEAPETDDETQEPGVTSDRQQIIIRTRPRRRRKQS
ncbi:carbon storage regulator [Thiorhodovibrio winogradskyi]|uniref:Carbon storage regulator n=1 Tax=Thiorhodovibrio winogradskyi TaxID=77007 RepID=A0ABZ0S9V4_9GAMM|nr:carbon storage regulator [Thiorhodovibrio winogradskyi]